MSALPKTYLYKMRRDTSGPNVWAADFLYPLKLKYYQDLTFPIIFYGICEKHDVCHLGIKKQVISAGKQCH